MPEGVARISSALCFGHALCGGSWSCGSCPSPGYGLYGDWSSHGHDHHDDFENDDCRDVNNTHIKTSAQVPPLPSPPLQTGLQLRQGETNYTITAQGVLGSGHFDLRHLHLDPLELATFCCVTARSTHPCLVCVAQQASAASGCSSCPQHTHTHWLPSHPLPRLPAVVVIFY